MGRSHEHGIFDLSISKGDFPSPSKGLCPKTGSVFQQYESDETLRFSPTFFRPTHLFIAKIGTF
jgi:hypothetical protein